MGIKSGFRISELLSLRLGDLVQNGEMVKRITVQRRSMKRKIEGRTVLLHPEAKAALSQWVEELKRRSFPESGYVFASQKDPDRPINRRQAWYILKGVYTNTGITGKCGTHSMRKTFADRVYHKLGRDLAKTQKALGHKNVNSTIQYLSFQEEEIDEAILAI